MRSNQVLTSLLMLLTAGLSTGCVPEGGSSEDPPIMVGDAGVGGEGGEGGGGGEAAGGGEAGQGGEGGGGEAGAGGGGEAGAGGEAGQGGMGGGGPGEAGLEEVVFEGLVLEGGFTDFIPIQLPEDVVSVTIIGTGDPEIFYAVTHFEGPDNTILVAMDPPGVDINPIEEQLLAPFPGPFKSPNRSISPTTGLATLLAPNNPQVDVFGGEWRFQIGGVGQFGAVRTEIDVKVLIKRSPEPPVIGTLDLHLHFTGARGWTAATAPEDADFQAALDRMESFYEEIGITLGEITYQDIPEAFREVDSGPQGPGPAALDSTLHQMFALSDYDTGLSLFFVDRIGEPMFGGAIGGIAGGTPGPQLQPNTTRSGVAVATELDPNPASIGHIMGHESGHFLGLFHTQEFIGLTDQIPDTPEGQAGDTNLMYPTVTSAPAALSDGQAFVLHRNPAVVSTQEGE